MSKPYAKWRQELRPGNNIDGIKALEWISQIASYSFIFLFIYAAFSKIQDFEKFLIQLSKSPLLNHGVKFFALAVPITEIVISGLLLYRKYQLKALYAAFCLMVLFTSYIVLILKFSPYIPCSCGGILDSLSWSDHLVFNIIFILVAVLGILFYPKDQRPIAIEGKADALE